MHDFVPQQLNQQAWKASDQAWSRFIDFDFGSAGKYATHEDSTAQTPPIVVGLSKALC